MENHGQTLERLAERGGLSLDEAAAVVERRRWRKTTADEALAALKNACTQRGVRVAQRLNPPEHDMSRRQEPRYDISAAVRVYVGDAPYFVFLADEIVVQEVIGRGGKLQRRRVTSRRIETSAILKASDAVNAG